MRGIKNLLCIKLVAMVFLVLPLYAEEHEHEAHGHEDEHEEGRAESIQESDFHIDDSLTERRGLSRYIFPHVHAFGTLGASTANPADLANGDHDPNREWTLQGFEPSLTLNAGDFRGYINVSGTTDSVGDLYFAIEEGFLRWQDLPFGFEIRGGQFLNLFGFQNQAHNHAWNFVDQNLVNGRFLNEGEMFTKGGEIAWNLPFLPDSKVAFSVGEVPAHAHGEAHGHGEESEFEAEGANFDGTLLGGAWMHRIALDEHKQLRFILSGAWGANGFGRRGQVYGIGAEYMWREHGDDEHAHQGRFLRWRSEAMVRHVAAISGHLPGEAEDEHGEDDHDDGGEHEEQERQSWATFDELGIYSTLVYGATEHIETGLRGGWVSGINRMGLDERFRVSPMITWNLNGEKTVQARLQYNWDHLSRAGSEHSIWLQIGFNWGAEGAHYGHDH